MPRARSIASALLVFTGIAHLLYAVAGAAPADAPGMGVFGVIYLGLGVLLRRPAAWPLWLALLIPAVGGIGGSGMLRERFDPVLALFVAIDVAVVGCCAYLLVTSRRA